MGIHKFEAAGLGKAPFYVVGVEEKRGPLITRHSDGTEIHVGAPGQPMGTCDFCGTGIAECWLIESSDGKKFVVGCDCVRKTADGGMIRTMKREQKKLRAAAQERRIEAARATLEAPGVRERLEALPHDHEGMASRGFTLLHSVEFLLEKGGTAGKLRAARAVEKAAKA